MSFYSPQRNSHLLTHKLEIKKKKTECRWNKTAYLLGMKNYVCLKVPRAGKKVTII